LLHFSCYAPKSDGSGNPSPSRSRNNLLILDFFVSVSETYNGQAKQRFLAPNVKLNFEPPIVEDDSWPSHLPGYANEPEPKFQEEEKGVQILLACIVI